MDQQMQPSSTEEAIPQSPPPQALTEEERLQRAFELADAQLEEEASQAGAERRADKGIVQKGIDLWKSAGAGIAKAGFETSDFIFGEPAEEDKTDLRRGIEQRGRELSAESGWNSLSMSTANIITGLIGAGKIMAPIKAVQKVQAMGKAGRAAVEIAKGAVAGATVMDPHEERLSDLIEQFPDLQNPVTEYLASDPSDGAAEGRFKNALEGIGADLALIGAVKAIKWWRMGDVEKAQKEISKLETARTANREAFGLPEELSRGGEVKPPEQKVPQNASASVGSGQAIPEDAAPSTGVADEATRSETAIGTHTAPSASGESTTAAASTMPLIEPPRVKESGIDAAAPPTAPSVPIVVTDNDLAVILKSTKTNLAAVKQYGSYEAAAEAGQIARRGDSLPWQKLRSSDEVTALTDNAARILKTRWDEIKGGSVMSDAQVNAMVEARAELFAEDPQIVMGQIRQAGSGARNMVADMEAGYLIGSRMMDDTYGRYHPSRGRT